MAKVPPIVLTIAGFDPSSGAGVTADIKTISAHDCYGVACVTAMTVQSTSGVRRVEPVSIELIRETVEELAADLEIGAVRIGMLGSAAVVETVASCLKSLSLPNIVLDPVLKSSSGTELLENAGIDLMIQRLFPLCAVITPNVEEAAALTHMEVGDTRQMQLAADELHSMGARAAVVTGGHLQKATDFLSFTTPQGIQREVFKSEKIRSTSTHGTGCAFASAIACHLALGRGLPEAVLLAKAFVAAAIANGYPLGRGVGPIHHLYRTNQKRRSSVEDSEAVVH